MSYPFKNLVFEGGGVKGIAYVGALKGLQERNILENVQRVGGTSAGAINAVLLSLGYSLQDMKKIMTNLDFNNFLDDDWGMIRDTQRLLNRYGWYKGDYFTSWIGKIIRKKTGNQFSTFNDFHNQGRRDLYLVATNLSTGYFEVFSAEHTPRMRVQDAVRMSMSIPLFFTAMTNLRGDVYVDGGVMNNYPVKIFDRLKYIQETNQEKHTRYPEYYQKENEKLRRIQPTSSSYVYNKETLGFRLDSATEIGVFRDGAEPPRESIDDIFDYIKALVKAIMNVESNQHIHTDDWHRTVYINTIGVGTVDFDIDDETKIKLEQEGQRGVQRYFDWYDAAGEEDLPINHPDAGQAVQDTAERPGTASPQLRQLRGIGNKRQKKLEEQGIVNLQDLLRTDTETLKGIMPGADVPSIRRQAEILRQSAP